MRTRWSDRNGQSRDYGSYYDGRSYGGPYYGGSYDDGMMMDDQQM